MIAVILAGGYAKRLWPLSIDKPKALLPVAGKPIIDYILPKIRKVMPPVSKIVVLTNLRFQPMFEDWLQKTQYDCVTLVPDKTRSEAEKIGAIGALSNMISGEPAEEFLILAGDSLFSDELSEFVRFFKERNAPVVALYRARNLAEAKRGAVVSLGINNRMVDCVEKPERPKTSLIGACLYAFPSGIGRRIQEYISLGFSRDQPGKFIAWLCRVEPVYGFKLNSPFLDIGTLDSYREAESIVRGN